uniref:Uncharacterized protein n=1 Tax=Trypanosoma vivax (strain Y486) TaxID=1055687 RepID=G0U8B2_TRYVY|nr:hypothetical protein, unlikely [Trypanosoma vivax Y486]
MYICAISGRVLYESTHCRLAPQLQILSHKAYLCSLSVILRAFLAIPPHFQFYGGALTIPASSAGRNNAHTIVTLSPYPHPISLPCLLRLSSHHPARCSLFFFHPFRSIAN